MNAEVIVLPVVRHEPPPHDPKLAPADRTGVIDMNSWVYMRLRRMVERREMDSLLGRDESA